jgi:hypothetical protein
MAVTPGGDLRDGLDAGSDIMVSRDPQVIDYAGRKGEFRLFPLPWDRTYAVLQSALAEPLVVLSDTTIREPLARDAVQAEARRAQPRSWLNGSCARYISAVAHFPTAARLVYLEGDAVARQLAERLVVLNGSNPELSAVGLDPTRFAAALEQLRDRAYIVALPVQPAAPCREAETLTSRYRIDPLVDTRNHAIVRRGSPALTVDWDGTVRVAPSRKRGEEAGH